MKWMKLHVRSVFVTLMLCTFEHALHSFGSIETHTSPTLTTDLASRVNLRRGWNYPNNS